MKRIPSKYLLLAEPIMKAKANMTLLSDRNKESGSLK
jgi:hypothetical protein